MKGFILSIIGDILLVNAAIVSTIGSKISSGAMADSNIPFAQVISGSFGGTALAFLILAAEVLLAGVTFSIIGLVGNIKRGERKLFNILGIVLGLPLVLASMAMS